MKRRSFEELDLIDDFLMNCVATDPLVGEACFKKMLSVLLEREIGKVSVVCQRVIMGADTNLRGIRMDVEVNESVEADGKKTIANVYDIEPHTRNDLDFPRHNRFYQAKIDSKHLKSGEKDFSKLPNLYVVTITNFDIFKEDYMVYTFRNSCIEIPGLEYPDGLSFVYFNTKGTKGGSQSIKNMLNFIQESRLERVLDEATKEIARYVEHVKADPALKEGSMTLDYYFDREREEGKIEGKIEDILELLEDIGCVPDDMRIRLEAIDDLDELKRLHKIAARIGSIAEFEAAMVKEPVSV